MEITTLRSAKVVTIMTKDLLKVHHLATVSMVNELFESNNLHHLPVVDDLGGLVGIISKNDLNLLRHWATKFNVDSALKTNKFLYETQLAKDIMSVNVVTVSSESTVGSCVDIFKENIFHSLPVVDGKELVGIVTPYDIINSIFS